MMKPIGCRNRYQRGMTRNQKPSCASTTSRSESELHRRIEQPEEGRLRAPRHRGKRRECRRHRDDRREREQPLVRGLRAQLLLEEQLDDVGERLEQTMRPDEIRAVALLHEPHDLALGEHEQRRRIDQHEEREADDEELDDEAQGGLIHQCAPAKTGALALRQSAGSVQRPSRTCASYSCLNSFIVVSTGVAAASPNAQSVLPTMLLATPKRRSRSFSCPSPRSMRWSSL